MWVAFANANAKATHIFSAKILAYMPYLMIKSFNNTLTNDITSFEQLGPDEEIMINYKHNFLDGCKRHILCWRG